MTIVATPAATATVVMMTAVLIPAAAPAPPAAAPAAAPSAAPVAVTVTPVIVAPAATEIDALVPMIWPAAFTTSTAKFPAGRPAKLNAPDAELVVVPAS